MSIRLLLVLCAVIVFAVSAGLAGDLQDLDVPLTLTDVSGAARVSEPVSSGVPMPYGLMGEADLDRIAVFAPDGTAVPAQFRALEEWREAGQEPGSIKWLLVTFLADVPAGERATYRLRPGANPAPDAPAEPVDGLGPFRLHLTNPAGEEFTDADVAGVDREVVETGPVRSCVKLESPSSHEPFGFIAWVYTYAGLDRTDLTVVLKNTPNERLGPFYFRDFSVAVQADGRQYLLGGEPGSTVSGRLGDEPVYLYQASCGTEQWEEFGGGNYRDALVMDWSQDKEIAKAGVCAFRGWRAKSGDDRLAEGHYALGWGGLRGEGGRTAVLFTRHFRENYPSAVEVAPGRVISRLLPTYYTGYEGLHWLDDSTRKRFDLSLQHHADLESERADGLAEAFNKPLVAHPGLEWLRATGIFGDMHGARVAADVQVKDWPHNYGGGSRFPVHANWVTFGGTTIDRIRRRYHDLSMNSFLRSGDPWAVYQLMIRTYHTSSLTPLWLDDYQHPRDRLNVRHYLGLARGAGEYREGTRHRGWRTWNMAHFDCQELFDAWRLFGDPLALDAVHDVGSYSQNYVLYRKEGGGTIAGTRSDGHPMSNLGEAHRVTGRRDFLESLSEMSEVAWNQVDKERGFYGVMPRWEGGQDNHDKPFMMAQVMRGLREYWNLTHCRRTLDLILGMHDFIQFDAMPRHPDDGSTYAHTYIVKLDLSAEELRESLAQTARQQEEERPNSPRPALIRETMWAYEQTGERRHWDDLNRMMPAIYRADGRNRQRFAWLAAWLEERADEEPEQPPAITDLEAEALGGGRVRLTWTTPENAADIHVKHAERPMVERAWPDQVDTHVNWWAAEHVAGVPEPAEPGERASMVVEGLEPGRRVFSARAFSPERVRAPLGAMAEVDVR